MAFTLKSISIVGGKIKFTIPKGTNLVFKLVGGHGRTFFVSDKELQLSVPIIIGQKINNNSWAPISNVFTLFNFHIHGTGEKDNFDYSSVYMNRVQFYAKKGEFKEYATTDNNQYHSIYNVSKLGIVVYDSKTENPPIGAGEYEGTRYIEDIDCKDASYQEAKNAINFNGDFVAIVSEGQKQEEKADGGAEDSKVIEPDSPENAQQAIKIVSKYNKGKGWIVGARDANWPEQKIQAYRDVINQYYNQKKANQSQAQATSETAATATQQQSATAQGGATAQPAQQMQSYNTPTHQQIMNGQLNLNPQQFQYDKNLTQQIMPQQQQQQQEKNAAIASMRRQQQLQQARAAFSNNIEGLRKRGFDDKKLNKIVSYVNSGNFDAAREAAANLPGGGKILTGFINSVENSSPKVVKENKKKTPKKAVMNESKLIDMITHAMLKEL